MLLSNLDLFATAPSGVARLRELILALAVKGKLVPQYPTDEPANVLLQKIRADKDRLIAEEKIKRDKPLEFIGEEEKPFQLPEGWEWTNLATIGVINPRNNALDETMASFVQMSSIPVEFSAVHISEQRRWKDIKSGFTQFAEGDVGVAKITPCFENGKSTVFQNLSNGIGAGTTELHIVRPLGGVERRYVLLFLKTPAFLREGEAVMTGSAGQKRLPRSYFERKSFPLPPLSEQSRIVTRVEELMRLCDALEAKGQLEATQHAQLVDTLLGTLTASATPDELADNWQRVAQHFDLLLDRPEAIDALEQTLLQLAVRGLLVPQDPTDEPASVLLARIRTEKDRLIAEGKIKRDKPLPPIADEEKPFELPVGWEWVRFDELTHPQKPIAYGVLVPGPDVSTGVRFVRIADLSLVNPAEKPEKTIAPAVDAQFRRTRLEGGEILMGVVGSIGKLGVAPTTWAGANIARAICRIVPADAGLHDFVLFLLQTKFMQDSFAGDTRTLAQPTLNVGLIRAAMTPMPPPAEQSRIVARVAAVRRLCAELRQRVKAAQVTQSHLAQALVESSKVLKEPLRVEL